MIIQKVNFSFDQSVTYPSLKETWSVEMVDKYREHALKLCRFTPKEQALWEYLKDLVMSEDFEFKFVATYHDDLNLRTVMSDWIKLSLYKHFNIESNKKKFEPVFNTFYGFLSKAFVANFKSIEEWLDDKYYRQPLTPIVANILTDQLNQHNDRLILAGKASFKDWLLVCILEDRNNFKKLANLV